MLKKGLLVALLSVSFTILFLVGCTSQEEETKTPAKNVSPTAQSEKPNKIVSTEESYKGKTITWIVPWGAGGGYDRAARTIAPFMEKYTKANVVVQNMTGAGGLIGTNQLYVSEPDGLTIGLASGMGATPNQIVGNKNVQFDLRKFTWIGGISPLEYLLAVGKNTPYNNVTDLQNINRPVKMAMGGAGSGQNIAPRLLAKALGIELHPVMGFSGTAETVLSVVRGETEGVCTDVSSLLPQIESGDLRPLIFVGKERHSKLPDVPTAMELDIDEAGREAVSIVVNLATMGRILGAPPGIPADKADYLRQALKKSLEDEELRAAAEKGGLFINYMTAEAVQQAIEEALAASPDVVKTIKEAFNQ